MIVQHHSEARNKPSITALTTMWADQNISKMLVSGVAAAAATSAGFIGGGNLFLAGGTARPRRENGIGRGLRRKSAETWAFVGPRKSLIFSPRIKTLIALTAGYQVEPRLASAEIVRALAAVAPRPSWRKTPDRYDPLPTQTVLPPLS